MNARERQLRIAEIRWSMDHGGALIIAWRKALVQYVDYGKSLRAIVALVGRPLSHSQSTAILEELCPPRKSQSQSQSPTPILPNLS